jgi:hypothetical protein
MTLVFVSVIMLIMNIFRTIEYRSVRTPSRKKLWADLRKLRDQIAIFSKDLIPWDKDEIAILSFNKTKSLVKDGFYKIQKGVLHSIYHEPMISYALKKYDPNGTNSILLARSTDHEYLFSKKGEITEVFIDNDYFGTISEDGEFINTTNQNRLGRINKSASEYQSVVVEEREVAGLLNPEKTDLMNQRAFQLLEKINEEEEMVLVSLSLMEIFKKD